MQRKGEWLPVVQRVSRARNTGHYMDGKFIEPRHCLLVTRSSPHGNRELARHPFGQVPTFEQGDLTLFETGSTVLCRFKRSTGTLIGCAGVSPAGHGPANDDFGSEPICAAPEWAACGIKPESALLGR